jgi:hypothetical protein
MLKNVFTSYQRLVVAEMVGVMFVSAPSGRFGPFNLNHNRFRMQLARR